MHCKVTKGTIHYERIGQGFPVLVLHSMGTDYRSMTMWMEPIFDQLEGFQRIYIDLPAHGESLISDSLRSSDEMIVNLLEFIDQLLPDQDFSLVGFSFGGYLAQGILHRRRQQVKGICLLAPALHVKKRQLPEKMTFNKDDGFLNTFDPDIRTAIETLLTDQTRENITTFLNEIQPGRTLANRTFLTSNWREKGYYLSEEPFQDVDHLAHPALFVLGKQDAICGYKDHLFLLDKFSNASFSVLDRAGHMLQIERREVVQSLIKDWVFRTIAFSKAKSFLK